MEKNKASLKNKIYRKIHWFIFKKIKPGNMLYSSFRHGKKYAEAHGRGIMDSISPDMNIKDVYITQIPNEGAGIGHQLANYIGGYHYSRIFGAKHVYVPFKNLEWDNFFGFGQDEITLDELKKEGYKVRRLPYFQEDKDSSMIRNIVESYNGQKVVLLAELDQFYQKQYEEIPYIKEKFENAVARQGEKTIYSEAEYNVAIHIRRGDIVTTDTMDNKALSKRWLDFNYYENIISELYEKDFGKPLHFYIFSQGEAEDFKSFEKYGKVTLCVNMSAKESFLHMVRADVLVTGLSSFSYKPALLSDGIRIVPSGFWHGYPDNEKWIVKDR